MNSSRKVDKSDFNAIKTAVGQAVNASNFRDDVTADGTIARDDAIEVKNHKNTQLP